MIVSVKFAVINRKGILVTPKLSDAGKAIDYFIKREIKKLLPSKKEKRSKWLELKGVHGYKCVTVKD